MKDRSEPSRNKLNQQTAMAGAGFYVLRLVIIGLLSLFTAPLQSAHGQTNNQNMKMINPPYIARTSNFMAIYFNVEAKEVQKLLPESVKVKSDDKGLATAGMEMYTTDQVYGMPNFSIAFIYIEVNVSGNVNGTSAYYPIWGVVNNDTALQNFRHFFNFPYKVENKISIQKGTEQVITIGASNGEGLTLKLQREENKPVSAEGIAPLLSISEKDGVLITEIPWLAYGNQASIVSFEVRAGSNKVLQMIQGIKPFYAQVSSNVFSYTKPITVDY